MSIVAIHHFPARREVARKKIFFTHVGGYQTLRNGEVVLSVSCCESPGSSRRVDHPFDAIIMRDLRSEFSITYLFHNGDTIGPRPLRTQEADALLRAIGLALGRQRGTNSERAQSLARFAHSVLGMFPG
jgi:hypothetical protein